jgi:hypothetical protein
MKEFVERIEGLPTTSLKGHGLPQLVDVNQQ